MALIVADRVQETSTTTGTGALTLLGAVTGHRAASAVCANGDTFTYYAEAIDANERPTGAWETGLGTWGTGNILTRTTIYASSNANAAVSWAAGTKRIGLGLVSNAALGPTTILGNISATNLSGTNTGDQSAASILTDIKTVDGTGSGLDADLLDGYNSSTTDVASTVVVRDTNKFIGISGINLSTNDLDAPATVQMKWNVTDSTWEYQLKNGVTLQSGQELHFYGRATEAIANGDVVMFAGTQGDGILIAKADAAAIGFHPSWIIGIATQDIAISEWGYVTWFGKVNNVNTFGLTLGAILYLDPAVPGGLTEIQPDAPNPNIQVAAVVRVATAIDSNNGILIVRPHYAEKLSNLQDVEITSITNGDLIAWDTTNNRWQNTAQSTLLAGDSDKLDNQHGSYYLDWDNFTNSPTTSIGDLIVGGALGVPTRLGVGGANTVLHGGSSPTYSQVVEDDILLTNVSTNNVTIGRHGLVPILPGNPSLFFNGEGNYTIPAGLSVLNSYSSTAFSGTSVTITHNFGTYPVVQVVDSLGAVLIPLSIVNNSTNDFTVTFNADTTGVILASVGSPGLPSFIEVTTSTYSISSSDRVIKVSSAASTITLLTAIGYPGKEFTIINGSPGSVTVKGFGAQTINKQVAQSLPPSSSMTVIADGQNYWII